MAITSGYNRTDGLEELRKSVNSKLNSIHPDEKIHPPGCENPSTRMKKSIHPDEKINPPGCKNPSTRMKKERKKGAISQDQFRSMDWHERLELVKHYQNVKDKDFDDGTFAFSVTTFKNLCNELHLDKCIVDMEHQTITEKKIESNHDDNATVITISREKRENVREKTFTLSSSTLAIIDELFADVKITNEERSKIIDSVIAEAFSNALTAKRDGHFSVEYAEKQEVKEVRNTLM